MGFTNTRRYFSFLFIKSFGYNIYKKDLDLFKILPNDNLITCSYRTKTDSQLRIWDHSLDEDQELIKTIETGGRLAERICILSNQRVAVAFNNSNLRIFDIENERMTNLIDHGCSILSMVLLSNGLILTGGPTSDPSLSIWDSESSSQTPLKTIKKAHDKAIVSLDTLKDASLVVSASKDGKVKLWKNVIDFVDII